MAFTPQSLSCRAAGVGAAGESLERLAAEPDGSLMTPAELQELVQTHSLLRDSAIGKKQVSKNLLMAVFADAFTQGMSWPLSSKGACESLLAFLEAVGDSDCINALIDAIKQMIEGFDLTPQEHTYRLASLGPGERYLINYGWRSTLGGGHCVVYEFERVDEARFNFTVYNLGEGAHYHPQTGGGYKVRFQPWLHFKNVPVEKLFYCDPGGEYRCDFLEVLLGKAAIVKMDKPQELYEALLHHLTPYLVAEEDTRNFMTSQRDGNCTWKTLRALMRRWLGKELDKRTMFFLKQSLLVDRFHTLFSGRKSSPKKEALYLLRMSAQKFMASTAKRLRASERGDYAAITVEETKIGYATAQDLLNRLDCHEKQMVEKMASTGSGTLPDVPRDHAALKKELEEQLLQRQKPKSQPTRAEKFEASISSEFLKSHNLSPENLIKSLLYLNRSSTPKSLLYAYINALPLPIGRGADFWNQVANPKRCLELLCRALMRMMEKKRTSSHSLPLPHKINGGLGAFAMIYQLILRIDQASDEPLNLAQYGVHYPGFQRGNLNTEIFLDPRDYERRCEIDAFFSHHHSEDSRGIVGEYQYTFNAASHHPSPGMDSLLTTILNRKKGAVREVLLSNKTVKALLILHSRIREGRLFAAYLMTKKGVEILTFNGYNHVAQLITLSLRARRAYEGVVKKGICPTQAFYYLDMFSGLSVKSPYPYTALREVGGWDSGGDLYLSSTHGFSEVFPISHWLLGVPVSQLGCRKSFEAYGLTAYGPPTFPIDLKELVHTRSEPTLTVPQLLHFEKRVGMKLDGREEIFLFDLFFFRNYYTRHGERPYQLHYPALEALQKRGVYFEQVVAFIANGLQAHIEDVGGPKPNIERALFYARLRSNIARLLRSEEGLPPIAPLLNSLEVRDDLSKDELRAVLFNRVYGHCWKGDDVDPVAFEEMIEAWLIFKQQPATGRSSYPYVEAHATQFVQQLLINLRHTIPLDVIREICVKVSERLHLSPISSEVFEGRDFPIYRLGNRNRWREFDLLSGEIRGDSGPIGTVINFPPLSCLGVFQELFGKRTHHYRQEGKRVCFSDRVYGEVRYSDGRFFCQIQDQWMAFVPQSETALPPILNECYRTWDSPYGGYYLTHPTACDVRYEVTREGMIIECQRNSEAFTLSAEDNILAHFANEQHILCHKVNAQQIEMVLPFYQSLAGEPLKFRSTVDGELIWEGHSKFRLAPDRRGVCGTYPHYLLLEERGGMREKVLLPCSSLVRSGDERHRRQIALDWSSEEPVIYIECELDPSGRLTTASVEGKLYLALLMLEQKRYRESLAYLEEIEPTQHASSLAGELLEQIIKVTRFSRDSSSNRAAICLKAYFCASRFYTGESIDARGEMREALKLAYSTYGASVHTRDSALDLNPEEMAYYAKSFPVRRRVDSLPMKIPTNSYCRAGMMSPFKQRWYAGDLHRSISKERYRPWIAAPAGSEEELVASFTELSTQNVEISRHFWAIYAKIRSYSWVPGERERLKLWLSVRLHKTENEVGQEPTLLHLLGFALSVGPQTLAPPPRFCQSESVGERKWWTGIVNRYNRSKFDIGAVWPSSSVDKAPRPEEICPPPRALSQSKREPQNPSQLHLVEPLQEEIDPICLELRADSFEEIGLVHPLPDPLQIGPDLLDEVERSDFQGIVESEIERTNRDLPLGQETLERRLHYRLTGNANQVGQKLESLAASLREKISDLEERVLVLANKNPKEDHKKFLSISCRGALVWETVTIEDLQWLFLGGDREAFRRANENLFDADAEILYKELADYFNLQVQLQRIGRAQHHLHKYQNGTPDEEKMQVANLLAQELGNTRSYQAHEDPLLLLFEYLSGFRLRPQQADLLRKILNGEAVSRKFVFQMIMGGGKTSVFATILSARAALRGYYSLVVVPPSLRVSVRGNLRGSLRSCFNRTLVELTVKREEINLDKLKEFQQLLDHALEHKEVILTTADDLAALELKFIEYIFNQIIGGGVQDEIRALGHILNQLHEKGSAIGDECDLLLSAFHEVNYPIGKGEPMVKRRINLLREINRILCDETLGLGKRVLLKENAQANLSPDAYRNHVAPMLAKALSHYAPLRLAAGEREGFIRYVLRFQDLNELDQQDRDFLAQLSQRNASTTGADRESGHLIALCKYMITKLLPVTLSKEGGRHYGRAISGQTGKVVPYLAVDTPATTEFGNHWEAISYQFQTALQFGIELKQAKLFAEMMFSEALARLKRSCNEMAFRETDEACYFSEMLDLPLKESYTQEELEKLQAKIGENPNLLLILEGWTIEQVVTHFSQRIKSTAQSVIDMIPNWIAMSGTPDNAKGYDPDFEILLDQAAEAQIAVKLLNDAEANRAAMHVITTTKPAALLREVLDGHPTPERVRCLLDSGGLFKEKGYNNERVARLLLGELQRRNERIEGILFFNRVEDDQEEKQTTPDTLCALKSPDGIPLVIGGSKGGTSREDIEKVGLSPENYFTFYDERHTTGSDIPQLFDTIGLLTCDERFLTSRTLYQTALRLRQRLDLQTTEYLVPDSMQEKIPEMRALLSTCLKNQAIKLSKEFHRAYKHMIDNIFRSHAMALLRQHCNDLSAVTRLFKAFQPFLVEIGRDEPYDQFGGVDQKVNSLLYFLDYGEKRNALFQQCCERCELVEDHIPEEATARLERIYQAIWDNRAQLQKEVLVGDQETIGITQEIELQQEEETEDQELHELQSELQSYLTQGSSLRAKKERATRETLQTLINKLATIRRLEVIEGLEGFIRNKTSRHCQPHPFGVCFSSNIMMSEGFAHPFHEFVSLFDPRFRPAGQLLIVKMKGGEQYRGVLLSEYEAALCKSLIDDPEARVSDAWLVQSDGTSLLETRSDLPDHPSILQLLINAAILNGDFAFLLREEQENALVQWIMGDQKDRLQERRIRLLKLKACENPTAFRRLNYLLDVHFSDSPPELIEQIKRAMKACKGADISKLHALGEDHRATIVRLDSELVNQLLPEQVWLLSIPQLAGLESPQLIQEVADERLEHLSNDAIAFLRPEQLKKLRSVTKIHNVPLERLHELESEQLEHLSNAQIRALRPNLFNHPDVIARLSQRQLSLLDPLCAPCLPAEYIAQLDPRSAAAVIANLEDKVKHLTTDKQLAAVSAHAIHHLEEGQLDRLTLELHGRLIRATLSEEDYEIADSQLEALGKERATRWIAQLGDEEIPCLNQAYFECIASERAPLLSAKQVDALTLEEHRQIVVHLLRDDHLEKIGAGRASAWIHQLSDEEIPTLHEAYLSCIDPADINRLSDEQAGQLTRDAHPEQVKALLFTNHLRKSLQEIAKPFVPQVAGRAVDRLNPYYISLVSLAQLRQIRNPQLLNAASAYQKLSMNFPQMRLLDSQTHQLAWVLSRLAVAAMIAAAIAYAVNYSYLTGGIVTFGALLATYHWRHYVIPVELEEQVGVQLPAFN